MLPLAPPTGAALEGTTGARRRSLPGPRSASDLPGADAGSPGPHLGAPTLGHANSRNPRDLGIIEGGRVHQALHQDSKNVLDALCRVKKCQKVS